jgi:hypothetical protein
MRRVAPLLLVLAATLALAACGGGASRPAAQTSGVPQSATFSPAALTRTAQTSAHVAFTGSVTAAGQDLSISGSGDIDSAAHKGTLDVGISLGTERMSMSAVLDGTSVYVGSSLVSSFLPSGKKWLKVSLASAAKTFGPSSFALTSPGAVPPMKSVRKVGTATIDGVETVEYTGGLDLSKLPPAARAALGAGSVTFRPLHVWIGSDGYVHRVRLDASASAGGTTADVVITTTLSGFGESLSVTLPPASETVDASRMQIPGLGELGV